MSNEIIMGINADELFAITVLCICGIFLTLGWLNERGEKDDQDF